MERISAVIAALLLAAVAFLPAFAYAQQAMCRETLEAWVRDKSLNARWNSDRTAVIMVRGGVEYVFTCPRQDRPPVHRLAKEAPASTADKKTAGAPAGRAPAPVRKPVGTERSGFEKGKRELIREIETSRSIGPVEAADNAVPPGGVEGRTVTLQPEVAAVVRGMTTDGPAAVKAIREDIARSEAPQGAEASAVARSFKMGKVPPLSRRFDNLRVGDVLLLRQPDDMLSPGFYKSGWIIIVDKALSLSFRARASHTFMLVREVKGVKLFLDNMPGQGTRIKTEAQITAEYDGLDFDVARPLSKFDTDLLWTASREYGIRSLKAFAGKGEKLFDKTDYGPFGDAEKVCSETSRWALIKAGMFIPETSSRIKKFAMDVDFGPSDFYENSKYFLVTPLEKLPAGDRK